MPSLSYRCCLRQHHVAYPNEHQEQSDNDLDEEKLLNRLDETVLSDGYIFNGGVYEDSIDIAALPKKEATRCIADSVGTMEKPSPQS